VTNHPRAGWAVFVAVMPVTVARMVAFLGLVAVAVHGRCAAHDRCIRALFVALMGNAIKGIHVSDIGGADGTF